VNVEEGEGEGGGREGKYNRISLEEQIGCGCLTMAGPTVVFAFGFQ
jgi:hypothetical protein